MQLHGPLFLGTSSKDSPRGYKAPALFLPRLPAIKVASGTGITLHMFNSSDCVVEDLTIHAAPYFAISSFIGDGGHVLRRVALAEQTQPSVALLPSGPAAKV